MRVRLHRPVLFLVLTVVLAGCGGLTQEDVDTAVGDAVAAAEADADESINEMQVELDAAKAQLEDLEATVGEVSAERDTLVDQVAEFTAALDAARAGTGDDPPLGTPSAVVGGDLQVVSEGLTLPTAPAGTVDVVAFQALGEQTVAVVVHNNTDGQVSPLEVSATVRDSGGTLADSDSTDEFYPILLDPGQVAVGELFFSGETPADGSVELTVDWAQGDEWAESTFPRHRLPIVEWVATGGSITGLVGNATDAAVDLVRIGAGCFSTSGELLGLDDTFADRDEIPAGDSSAFTLRLDTSCDLLVLAASGWEA